MCYILCCNFYIIKKMYCHLNTMLFSTLFGTMFWLEITRMNCLHTYVTCQLWIIWLKAKQQVQEYSMDQHYMKHAMLYTDFLLQHPSIFQMVFGNEHIFHFCDHFRYLKKKKNKHFWVHFHFLFEHNKITIFL